MNYYALLGPAAFLGVNEWDDMPFIVMLYMKNGNARDYVEAHPACNRLWIVCPTYTYLVLLTILTGASYLSGSRILTRGSNRPRGSQSC